MNSDTISVVDLEAARADILAFTNKRFDELVSKLVDRPSAPLIKYKMPTAEDGRDPRNKNGYNLTDRGVEILYRMFDDGAGYNRASKMLNITQAAAKNRKKSWETMGGMNRKKAALDIDK